MLREHRKIIEYLPEFLQEYREYQEIFVVDQMELDAVRVTIDQMYNNQFVETCDAETIGRYEKVYGIIPPGGSTLDERRFHVLAKMSEEVPYTIRNLCAMLGKLCGETGYQLAVNTKKYTVNVKVDLRAKNNLAAVRDILRKVIPAHILWTAELLYNWHSVLAGFTHLQLSKYTHQALTEEVIK